MHNYNNVKSLWADTLKLIKIYLACLAISTLPMSVCRSFKG